MHATVILLLGFLGGTRSLRAAITLPPLALLFIV
jgi:hypothetical protein